MKRPIIMTYKIGSKFALKWKGPYVVSEVYLNGAYKIVNEQGIRVGLMKSKFLKRYFA